MWCTSGKGGDATAERKKGERDPLGRVGGNQGGAGGLVFLCRKLGQMETVWNAARKQKNEMGSQIENGDLSYRTLGVGVGPRGQSTDFDPVSCNLPNLAGGEIRHMKRERGTRARTRPYSMEMEDPATGGNDRVRISGNLKNLTARHMLLTAGKRKGTPGRGNHAWRCAKDRRRKDNAALQGEDPAVLTLLISLTWRKGKHTRKKKKGLSWEGDGGKEIHQTGELQEGEKV